MKRKPITREVQRGRVRLAAAYNALHAVGLFDYAGDVSLRLEDGRFLVRAARAHVGRGTGRSKLVTTPVDIVVVSEDGEKLEGDGTLSSEIITHTAIFQARPEVRSVVHAHARMVTVVSMVEKTIMACHSRGVEVTSGDGPAFFDSADGVSSPEEAKRLIGALGEEQGIMLRSHGIVTVGPTLESACNTAVNMEDAALMYWMARMIGQPTPLPAASLLRRKKLWANPEFASSVWSYYEQLGARASGARSTSRSRIPPNLR